MSISDPTTPDLTSPDTTSPAPSAGALVRSTLLALAVAGVLLVTCVLPAEYGVDLTGAGRVLGLTQMGEVKQALAEEAAANAAAEASADSVVRAAEEEMPVADTVPIPSGSDTLVLQQSGQRR
jgi:hypothetical protein